MTASNKGPLSDRNYEIFEKIAVDYKDCSIKSKRGYKGIMLYSDRKSDYIHPILVKNKKNVIEQLDYINNMVKNKNKIWKILQSDSEWIFSKGPIKKW
jgi:AMMECR1 domain-containing protein